MTTKKAAIPPLLSRLAAFLLVCIVCTGIIGPRIISNGLLEEGGFAVYGGAGKALIFGTIAFFLLVRGKLKGIKLKPWINNQLVWGVACMLSLAGAWLMVTKLIDGQTSLINILITHGLMIASIVFAAFATIGMDNLRMLYNKFKRELLISAVIAVVFYAFLWMVYGLWRFLSILVLHSVSWLLRTSGLEVAVVPDLTLILDKFGVTIEKFCSGIESIALFSGLYAIVGVLDWPKLNKRRFIIAFPIALIVLFIFNIFRVYLLIMAGYYINTQLAFSLFHTYAGMLFFMLYAGAFWTIMYKHLIIKPASKKEVKDQSEQ